MVIHKMNYGYVRITCVKKTCANEDNNSRVDVSTCKIKKGKPQKMIKIEKLYLPATMGLLPLHLMGSSCLLRDNLQPLWHLLVCFIQQLH